jgi:hypothetical protein
VEVAARVRPSRPWERHWRRANPIGVPLRNNSRESILIKSSEQEHVQVDLRDNNSLDRARDCGHGPRESNPIKSLEQEHVQVTGWCM